MKLYISILLIFLLSATTNAQEILNLNNTASEVDLSPYLYFYEDPSGTKDLNDIRRIAAAGKFIQNSSPEPAFGLSNSAIWGKFSLKGNTEAHWYLVFKSPTLNSVKVFLKASKSAGYKEMQNGNQIPLFKRTINDHRIIFPVNAGDNLNDIYFRVESKSFIDLSLSLLSPSELLYEKRNDTGYYGIFTGIILSMLLYNFFIFITTRDISYLYYVLYTFFNYYTLTSLRGYASEFIFKDNHSVEVFTTNLSTTLAVIFAILFTRKFLNTAVETPKIESLLKVSIPLFLFNFILGNTVFGRLAHTIHIYFFFILLPIGATLLITAGFYSYKKYSFARYYTHAWLIYLVIIILYSLQKFSIFTFNLFDYSLETGSAIEVMLLSFALANRIKLLQNLADLDELTGIFNRRALQTYLDTNIISQPAGKVSPALVLIDLDNFKRINDHFGHTEGDRILKEFSRIISNNIRGQDFFSRWGGEEFVIVTLDLSKDKIIQFIDKIRKLIEAHDFEINQPITASFGVAMYNGKESARDLFFRADKALYKAKTSGKNRIEAG